MNEFRNHLSLFLAASSEISAALPASLAARHADMLSDMASSVAFLNTLVTWMDVSLADGSHSVSELTDIMIRARALALPALGPRARIRIDPLPTTVRDRGGALECALAALLTELGRGFGGSAWIDRRDPVLDLAEIRMSADPCHGQLGLVLSAEGGRPTTPTWRVKLAAALLAKVDGTVTPERDGTRFEIRFRYQ